MRGVGYARVGYARVYCRDYSTYWRATCEFPSVGIDYRDYVRAKLADVDPVTYSESESCKTVEYINIRGHV